MKTPNLIFAPPHIIIQTKHVDGSYLTHKLPLSIANFYPLFPHIVLKKILEGPLDSKEINPRCSLEGLMLKLKLQYLAT